MSTFVFRLKPPRFDSGQMVVFGPVLDSTRSWGLGGFVRPL